MRLIGFIGILGLLVFCGLGLLVSIHARHWKAILAMLALLGLVAFFAFMLWRGRKLEREPGSGRRLADGWAGEPVGAFLRHQMLKSLEGRVYLAGSAISLLFAAVTVLAPSAIGLDGERAGANATLFGLWPVMAFLAYVKICGPAFSSSRFSTIAMVIVFVLPFLIAYK